MANSEFEITLTNGPPSIMSGTTLVNSTFVPILYYDFPPFFTLQRNLTTRSSQLQHWSAHVVSYAAHHRLFALTLSAALASPLFANEALDRRLSELDARAVLEHMASAEGGQRVEWVTPASRDRCYVWWRRVDEWAAALEEWVDRTGQKGAVLTLYELASGEQTRSTEWWGMDADVLRKVVQSSVRRGKAAIFGGEGEEGVKYF